MAARYTLVAGTGTSGTAAAAALRATGVTVTTVDAHAGADLPDNLDWSAYDFSTVDLLVTSPGWPPHHRLLACAAAAGVEVISEVELAWRLRVPNATGEPAPWLVVTGTNGKTTTVGMLEAILAADGRTVAAVGNVGKPVTAVVTDPNVDVLAVELSSFQLHYTTSVSPLAAVCLNIADDHLDWHGSFAAYRADKASVYDRTQRACLYPATDPAVEQMVRSADVVDGARAVGYTLGIPRPGQLGVVDDLIVDRAFHTDFDDLDRDTTGEELATFADLARLAGPDGTLLAHTVTNALAAAGLARAAGVAPESVARGLAAFGPGGHRLTLVDTVDGVRYVDDSKATNAHAAAAALRAFGPGQVVWIAGGLAKGAHFDDLVADYRTRLAGVVVIGVDQTEITGALARHASEVPVVSVSPGETDVMTTAVTAARALARPGQVVLLAPACASMDQFVSYVDRGDAFAAAVRKL